MKKSLFYLVAGVLSAATVLRAQPVKIFDAPKYDGASTSASGPNGTSNHDYHRAAFLVLKTELTQFSSFTNSVVTTFGFNYLNGADVTVTGNFTLYLQNTPNTTYSKGGTWSTIVSGMNQYYKGNLTIPAGTNTTSVDFPLDSNFTYTGGGVYVAIEWEKPGSTATTPAWYLANSSGLANGGVRNYGLSAPATLTATAFRPAFRWGAVNTATNELSIDRIEAHGHHAKLYSQAALVSATLTNRSVGTKSFIPVYLDVTGANPFKDTLYPSLAPGASTVVTFNSYFPMVEGLSTISVSIDPDQNNTNNAFPYSQSVTCNVISNYPGNIAYTAATGYVTWTSSYGFNSGNGMLLERFNLANTTSLTGVRIALGAATSNTANGGQEIFGVVVDQNGTIVAKTPSYLMAQAGQLASLGFTNTPVLTANQDYYIGVAQPTSGYFPLATRAFTTMPVPRYYVAPYTGGSLTAVSNFTGFFGIAPEIKAPEMIISASGSPTFVCKGQPVTLTVTGAPGVTFTWVPGNLQGSSPTVTIQPVGSQTSSPVFYQVIGTHTATGCQTQQATVTLSVSLCTGLGEDIANYGSVELFPNPAAGGITRLHGLQGANKVTVLDLRGQVVKINETSAESFEVDLSNLAPATYFIQVSNNHNQLKVFKVLTH